MWLESFALQKRDQVRLDPDLGEIEHYFAHEYLHVVPHSIQKIHLQNLAHFDLELVKEVSLKIALIDWKESLIDIGNQRAEQLPTSDLPAMLVSVGHFSLLREYIFMSLLDNQSHKLDNSLFRFFYMLHLELRSVDAL